MDEEQEFNEEDEYEGCDCCLCNTDGCVFDDGECVYCCRRIDDDAQ
jgi:hypothetical protein